MMRTKTLNTLIEITIIVILILGGYTIHDYYTSRTIKIAEWNLHVFGYSKESDINLMRIYSSIIDNYDIIFVQEIRDKSGTAFPKLCSMLSNYSCVVSSRAGKSNNKEQYGLIYRHGINLTMFKDYNPDQQGRWERPPIEVKFNIDGYKLTVYNIHTKPDDTSKEIRHLNEIVQNKGNVIVLGDLNADCSYFNHKKEKEFAGWHWIISDDKDTTVGKTNCAYDRIIMNNDAYNEFASEGVYKKGITKEVSDHYLVWVEIKI